MPTNWIKDYQQVIYFMQILWHVDILESADDDITDLVNYLNNPRRYEAEHQLWAEMDLPDPGDSNWEEFQSKVTQPDLEASYGEDVGEEEEDEEE